jgi:hypothetical protein
MGHAACAGADSLHGKQPTMTAYRYRGCGATLHGPHGGLTAASAHCPAAHLQARVQVPASAAKGSSGWVAHPMVRLPALGGAHLRRHLCTHAQTAAQHGHVQTWPWAAHGTLHILDQGAVHGCRLHASAGARGAEAALHLSPEAPAPACTHSTRQHTSCDWRMPHRVRAPGLRAHACCCSAEWTQPGTAPAARRLGTQCWPGPTGAACCAPQASVSRASRGGQLHTAMAGAVAAAACDLAVGPAAQMGGDPAACGTGSYAPLSSQPAAPRQ